MAQCMNPNCNEETGEYNGTPNPYCKRCYTYKKDNGVLPKVSDKPTANIEVKHNVSQDQRARTYSNILVTLWDKRKKTTDNLKEIDNIYNHFLEVMKK
ncbi:MAG: hypothetical protein ACTSX6_04685 [Candidatus Heimdallarchaeaceae archaeon]